jgi:glycopeptide antibiotics resistance protein
LKEYFTLLFFFYHICRVRDTILPWARQRPGPKALILDNVSFHMSPEVVKLLEEEGVRLVGLPTNSTYITQPLDVSFFGPFKKVLRSVLKRLVHKKLLVVLFSCDFSSTLLRYLQGKFMK